MIFIPRPAEEAAEAVKESRIELWTRQVEHTGYELTTPDAKQLKDYEPILDMLLQVARPDERLFLAVEWAVKRNCIIILTDNIDSMLQTSAEKDVKMKCRPIPGRPWEQISSFIEDRTEFEGLADLMAKCVIDPDSFYLCFDWKSQRNCTLWATNQPSERQMCIEDQGISLASSEAVPH